MQYWRNIRSAGVCATYFGKEIEQRMQTAHRPHPTGIETEFTETENMDWAESQQMIIWELFGDGGNHVIHVHLLFHRWYKHLGDFIM